MRHMAQNLHIDAPTIKSEYAKYKVKEEMLKKNTHLNFFMNELEEKMYKTTLHGLCVYAGFSHLLEKIDLHKTTKIPPHMKKFLNNIKQQPQTIKFESAVEDLLNYWAVHYSVLDESLTKVISFNKDMNTPAIVDKRTGDVLFISHSELNNMRAIRREERNHKQIPTHRILIPQNAI